MVHVLCLGRFDPTHNLGPMEHPRGFSEKTLGEWSLMLWNDFGKIEEFLPLTQNYTLMAGGQNGQIP